VFAFDQRTGVVRWRHRIEMDAADSSAEDKGARTGLTRSGQTILFATYSGRLIALDLETGKRQWDFASPEFKGADLGAFQQAVLGGRVFYGSPKALHAFDVSSGREIWQKPLAAPISTGIVVSGERLYFGTADSHVYRVNPARGDVEATIATRYQPGYFLPSVVGTTLVVQSAGAKQLEAFDLDLKQELWSLPANKSWGSPQMAKWGEMLIAGDEDGDAVAIRLANLSIAWTKRIGGIIRGVQVDGDAVYAGNTLGDLVVFPASQDSLQAR